MSTGVILGMCFLVFVAFLLGVWHYWNRVTTIAVPDLKLRRFLMYVYVALTASFLILGTLLVSYQIYTTSLGLSTALMLSLALIFQAAAVGALLTPVVIKRFPNGQGFFRRCLAIECCIITPIICVLGVNLWLFIRTGAFITKTLGGR